MAARACNDAGIALIKQFEGAGGWDATAQVFRPYADPIEIWTIGWGHEITVSHEALRGQACGAQADQLYPGGLCVADATSLLQDDVSATCAEVQGLLKVTVNDNQFAALVSFTYNLGVENLAASTLLKLLNQGDVAGAAQQFKLWDHAGGVVLPGLVKRRQAEANLFLLPVA